MSDEQFENGKAIVGSVMGRAGFEGIEAITTSTPYIGYPRTNGSLRAAQRVFDEWGKREDWKLARPARELP